MNDKPEPMSFEELRRKALEPRVEEQPQVSQADHLINKAMIRPKHIEDTSVSYKSSGYLRDLIGEE